MQATFLARLKNVEFGVVTDALTRLDLSGFMEGVLPIGSAERIVARASTLKFAPPDWCARAARQHVQRDPASTEGISPRDRLGANGCLVPWGEHGARAHFLGLAGIVSDSKARDIALLRKMEIPVFARGASVRPPMLDLVGVDVAIECGGAQVRPGDYIVADADGVVVIPHAVTAEMLIEIEDLEQLERDQEAALAEQAPLEVINDLLRRKKTRR